jgi:radical SAM superfamily enzyme YgiQ (UPF0313 family)
MSSRVLLISINRCATPDPVFPLALAHLNSALRQAGHQTRWFDFLAHNVPLDRVLAEFPADYVGISVRNIDDVLIRKQETFFTGLDALCANIRTQSRAVIILGGSGFSIFPRELFAYARADYAICGEGEAAFADLIRTLNAGGDPQTIPGLVFERDGRILCNPPAPATPGTLLADSDLGAGVAGFYLENGGMLNVQTQRGCAFHCCYCTYPVIEGRLHRRRAGEEVADEFERAARVGAKYLFVVDSVFNSSPRHVHEICEALVRRNLKIPWGCFLRPQGLTREEMRLMARAGLAHIEFGSDSFCDEVLHAYGKGFVFEDVLNASQLAHEEKIDCCHFLISGGPGETRQTLQEGFENSRRLEGAIVMAVVGMRIYPGTALFQRAVAEGQVEKTANLLNPVYYVSRELDREEIFRRLQQFARLCPNWIVGDPSPAYASLVERLRRRGVIGPLWSYLSMIQRLWPQGLTSPTAPVAAAHA